MHLRPLQLLLGMALAALPLEAAPARPRYSANHYYYYYLMGRYHYNVGNTDEAAEYLETALLLNRESIVIARELAELYYLVGDYETSLSRAAMVYGHTPEDLGVLELYAELLINTGRRDRALEIFKDMVGLAPEREEYRFSLAALYEYSGDLDAAVNEYLGIIRRDRANTYARLAIADIYLSMEEHRAAISYYLDAVKHGADASPIYIQIGRIYHHSGRARQAVRYLERAIDSDPQDWTAHATLSDIYMDMNLPDKAEEVLKNLIEIYPDDYASRMRLGVFYTEIDDAERAKEVFLKLADLFPEEYSVWHFLAIMQEYLDMPEDALYSIRRALDITETDQGYFHVGIIYDHLEKEEESYGAFKRAIELNPEHAAAMNYLGYIWADRGINLEEAKELIKRALEIEPENGAYLDSLGWVYYRLSRYEEALKYLKKADERLSDPIIIDHIGDTYLKLDEISSAIEAYRRALSLDPENEEIKEKLRELEE